MYPFINVHVWVFEAFVYVPVRVSMSLHVAVFFLSTYIILPLPPPPTYTFKPIHFRGSVVPVLVLVCYWNACIYDLFMAAQDLFSRITFASFWQRKLKPRSFRFYFILLFFQPPFFDITAYREREREAGRQRETDRKTDREIQNTQEIKRTLFNWTKQDISCRRKLNEISFIKQNHLPSHVGKYIVLTSWLLEGRTICSFCICARACVYVSTGSSFYV